MGDPTCGEPGCTKPLRSREMCAMHYHRWYRHGSPETVGHGVRTGYGRRYRSRMMRHLPIAPPSGRVYEHRAVLFAKIGEGPHWCHWCSAPINWAPKGMSGELQADHLNAIGDDNRPENLVAACPTCNTARAMQQRSQRLRSRGWWSQNDTVAGLKAGRREMVGG